MPNPDETKVYNIWRKFDKSVREVACGNCHQGESPKRYPPSVLVYDSKTSLVLVTTTEFGKKIYGEKTCNHTFYPEKSRLCVCEVSGGLCESPGKNVEDEVHYESGYDPAPFDDVSESPVVRHMTDHEIEDW